MIALWGAVLTLVLLGATVCAGAYTASSEKGGAANAGVSQTQEGQAVVYDYVEMRYSEGDELAYITNERTNRTTKKIVSCDRAMLAYDKEGNPLELDWWSRDGELNYSYLQRHGGLTREILPGEKDEQSRGWRLNAALDPHVKNVSYVLYCDIEITFDDGTVWKNPEYESWLSGYEGKKVDVSVLENYYPFREEITFND